MSYAKFFLLFLLMNILVGCAIYDPNRGVFVSSSVQTIPLDLPDNLEQIAIPYFNFPTQSLSDNQSSTYAVSGVFLPVSHTYGFDDVDKTYLYDSVITSFRLSNVKVSSQMESAPELKVSFLKLGMVSAGYNKSVLTISAKLEYIENGISRNKLINVTGDAKMTIASSKDHAIKLFLNEVAKYLKEDKS